LGRLKERRQVHDLPVLRLEVTQHQVEERICPSCQHRTVGTFPHAVQAPAQYGPRVRSLAVYLSQYQLLPMERLGEVFEDLLGCSFSEGTLTNWIQEAARTLAPTMQILKQLRLPQKLDHVDETGGRIKGLLHWCACQCDPLVDTLPLASAARTQSNGCYRDFAAVHGASDP